MQATTGAFEFTWNCLGFILFTNVVYTDNRSLATK
jgi:hypothetical protein